MTPCPCQSCDRPATYSPPGAVEETIADARATYTGPEHLTTLTDAIALQRAILTDWWIVRRARAWREVGLVRPAATPPGPRGHRRGFDLIAIRAQAEDAARRFRRPA